MAVRLQASAVRGLYLVKCPSKRKHWRLQFRRSPHSSHRRYARPDSKWLLPS